MPVSTEIPGAKTTKYKMRLFEHQFLPEHGGHCPAGSVLIVDEETAERWYERHIAEPAGSGDKTIREIRREENLKKLQSAAVEVDEKSPTNIREPVGRTKRRVSRKVKPDLRGAGVINNLDDTPDDDAYGAGGGEDDEE